MNVAVTGGSGQLGTLVLRRLVQDRSIKRVISIDVRPPVIASAKLQVIEADVRDPALERHLEGCDAVVHLAFVVTTNPGRAIFQSVNVDGSKNVFRAAVSAGVKRILYASSVAAYGVTPGHPVPIVETSERKYVADFAYSATKYEVEEYLDDFEKDHPEIAVARFRPGILMGSHMEHALGAALERRRIVALSDAPTPLVWDEDVADAFHLAIKREVRGAFNLVTDDALSAAQIAHAADLDLVKIPRALVLGFAKASPILSRLGLGDAVDPAWVKHAGDKMIVSNEKAKSELGWTPKAPKTADVMRKTLESMHGRTDARIALFMRLAALASKRAQIPEDARRSISTALRTASPPGGVSRPRLGSTTAHRTFTPRLRMRPTASRSSSLTLVGAAAITTTSVARGRERWILRNASATPTAARPPVKRPGTSSPKLAT